MASSEYREALWQGVPAGAAPFAWELRRRFLLERVHTGDRVLDVGCAEGAFAAELAGAGAQVLGVDIAEEPLRRARDRHPGLELALLPAEGDWGLADASFDVVWAGEVIEHVLDTAAWLSELRRVLRSGGRLLMSTPAVGPVQLLSAAISTRAFAQRFDPLGDHVRFYGRSTLAALIAEFGFEQIAVRAVGGPPGARRLLLAEAVRSRF
jgi:2-polyprenyl-3-methyl-5-hydroxy-6-metoxy-1,4-benzoquinol methylase